MGESDTPREAGGLKVGPPQRRSSAEFRRRAKARLCEQFRTVRLFHPRFLVRGCIDGLAPVQSRPWRLRTGGSRRGSPDTPARKIRGFRFFIRVNPCASVARKNFLKIPKIQNLTC